MRHSKDTSQSSHPLIIKLAIASLLCVSQFASAQSIIFVNQQASGLNDGTSWQNGFVNLQPALQGAVAPVTIWVAAGTYKPGTSRGNSFELRNNIRIFGGFVGNEEATTFNLGLRNFDNNTTILDGNIGSTLITDNILHIVTADSVNNSAILDGFTITGGHANGVSISKQDVGGGLIVLDASPTIEHCTFIANRAGTQGGAVHVFGGAPMFTSCAFLGNATTVTQGNANLGGAAYIGAGTGQQAGVLFTNCLFSGNRAGVGGGGAGGAIYTTAGIAAVLVNCTLVSNQADNQTGGIFGSATITNSILWQNTDAGPADQSAQLTGTSFTINHSCVQGWTGSFGGSGNIEDDPLFVDALGSDLTEGTIDDNARLAPGSPAIDTGDNSAITVSTDLDGNPRIINGLVDMGAYERCNNDVACDDGDACTIDRCDNTAGRCIFEGINCSDNVFCNGIERCVSGTCEDGPDPCANMHCNETQQLCAMCLEDIECDDAVFCNGLETCVAGDCSAGTPVTCDDGIDCTVGSCDEGSNSCVFTPDDALCDNGLYCDGDETCDAALGCQAGTTIDCDDTITCTTDSCDDTMQVCVYTPNDAVCDDSLFCNGVESCDLQAGCSAGISPCATPLTCDETLDECVGCLVDGDCDDGNPCTIDRCVDAVCDNVNDPNCCMDSAECNDSNPCTDDACVANLCESSNNASLCDDGDACTEADTCNSGTCAGTAIPNCGGQPPPPTPSDQDGDGIVDNVDVCPGTLIGDVIDSQGCSCQQLDSDSDGQSDCDDACPNDPSKTLPGPCGCGVANIDTDEDGNPDCIDNCPADANKTEPGLCDCGESDLDSDADGVPDCTDLCPNDPNKTRSGLCGCGISDADDDGDGTPNCEDSCPTDPAKKAPGLCGCDFEEDNTDTDADGVLDCVDACPLTAGEIQDAGCPPTLDDNNSAGQPLPGFGEGQVPPLCGSCGALSLWGWSALALGLVGMRRLSPGRFH